MGPMTESKSQPTEAKFDQYAARPVTDDYLASWMTSANAAVPFMRLGEFNWPMVVRSLIAEIERLRNEVASADASSDFAGRFPDNG